jgi:hypothetical protein
MAVHHRLAPDTRSGRPRPPRCSRQSCLLPVGCVPAAAAQVDTPRPNQRMKSLLDIMHTRVGQETKPASGRPFQELPNLEKRRRRTERHHPVERGRRDSLKTTLTSGRAFCHRGRSLCLPQKPSYNALQHRCPWPSNTSADWPLSEDLRVWPRDPVCPLQAANVPIPPSSGHYRVLNKACIQPSVAADYNQSSRRTTLPHPTTQI